MRRNVSIAAASLAAILVVTPGSMYGSVREPRYR